MNKIRIFLGLMVTTMLFACMGQDITDIDIDDHGGGAMDTVCQRIDGATYLSVDLRDGPRTANRTVAKMHWRAHFSGGVITLQQSDFVMSGTYDCAAGEVTATLATDSLVKPLVFSKDLTTLEFSPLGEPVTYKLLEGEPDPELCNSVRGLSFAPAQAQEPAEISERRAAKLDLRVSFRENQVALLTENGVQSEAIYVCDFGSVHIHRNSSDTNPIEAVYDAKLNTLSVSAYGQTQVLSQVLDPIFCTKQYDPVCAVVPSNVQCLVAPCPVGSYKTFGNECEAGAAEISFSGECGELEGQPVFDHKPDVCTKEYRPVCAAVTQREPCSTMPCPNQTLTTFANRCEADAAVALFVKSGDCGQLEGSPLRDLPGVACITLFDPVCGKDESDLVCVKAPCPTHIYKTQSNQCVASANVAEVVYQGACGLLEGAVAGGEPPVKMVSSEAMPKTQQRATAKSVFFNGDLVTMKLHYTGCGAKHFELYIDNAFMESFPVQVKAAFIPQVEEFCKADVDSEFTYDLAPLRSAYQSLYKVNNGSIMIQGVGLFEF